MEKFVGQDHIDSNNVQYWYQLLSCSFNFMRVQDPQLVEKTLEPYLVRLSLSNSQSFNLGSLLRVFIDRVSRIKSASGQSTNPYYVFQSFNALYLIRSICKSYIESSGEELLIKSFRAKIDEAQEQQNTSSNQSVDHAPTTQVTSASSETTTNSAISNSDSQQTLDQTSPSTSEVVHTESPEQLNPRKTEFASGTSMLDQLVSTLIAIVVDIPLDDPTYLLKVESINTLLVLLSVQMYSASPASQSTIYRHIMCGKSSIHALILSKTLLVNFVGQHPVPQESGSIIIGLASGLWKVLTLGYGTNQEEDQSENMPLLARQSLLLLNVLTNHYTTEKNPYREAIVSCQDSAYNLTDATVSFQNASNDAMATATTSKSAMMSNSIKIDFRDLYDTICKYLNNDQVALLLYLLLHSNKIFRPYILTTASRDLDKLLLPLLKILYSSIEKGSHHVYMVLIIFIILSEEASFNKSIHEITIRGVPWYKDRLVGDISLGSLTALIIIRSFQYNTFKIRDKFLHTNLFATLANLSNHFLNLHPYVCQRLIELLEKLSKRYLNITKASAPKTLDYVQTPEILKRDDPLAKALATDTIKQRDVQDASSIELDSTTSSGQQVPNTININIPEQQVTVQKNIDAVKGSTPSTILNQQDHPNSESNGGQPSPGSNSTSEHINISFDDQKQDIGLIEEVIRMILEVINNTLANQLVHNSDFIYTLLYKRNVFSSLMSSHQSFYNMVINVERILTFFYNEIESYDHSLSEDEIKSLIQASSQGWNIGQEKDTNARLLFHYVEDEQPEEFFIPYIWTRIFYASGIPWNSKRVVLFNPDDL